MFTSGEEVTAERESGNEEGTEVSTPSAEESETGFRYADTTSEDVRLKGEVRGDKRIGRLKRDGRRATKQDRIPRQGLKILFNRVFGYATRERKEVALE